MKNTSFFFFLFVCVGLFSSCSESDKNKTEEPKPEITESRTVSLASWQDDARERILNWLKATTTEGAADFIPVADRVAVFDNDGTLWPEQPYPNQVQYAFDYIKSNWDAHPEWAKNKVLKAAYDKDLETLTASGMAGLMTIVAAAHANMSAIDFTKAASTWADTATSPHYGKLYKEIIYLPMMELVNLLRENDFKVFIVSGGGVDFMRAFTEEIYGIPPYQVIGSYSKAKYDVVEGKPIITKLTDDLFIDDKGGKPEAIYRFIGKTPVFCGGNSDGDQAMMQYTSGSGYKTICVILHHTDAEREFAYDTKTLSGHLETALVEANEKNWLVVDMKTDFKKIFPWDN